MVSVNIFSKNSSNIEKFLSLFYDTSVNINKSQTWQKKYQDPVEMTEIIGTFIDNYNNFDIDMWVSIDNGVYIQVSDKNANSLIKYLYERYPW